MIRYEKRDSEWVVILNDPEELKELMEFEDYMIDHLKKGKHI